MADWRTSARADDDLLDIYLFGIERFGRVQAIRYLDGLEQAFALLAAQPRMGRAVDGIAHGVRRHEHGSHVILYELIERGVRILAIVHQSSVRGLTI